MTASKRKNEDTDDILSQQSKMVIVGYQGETEANVSQDTSTTLLTTIERMKKLSEEWAIEQPNEFTTDKKIDETGIYDAIAQSIGSVIDDCEADISMEKSLLQKAEEIKKKLSCKMKQATDLRKKEADVLGELSSDVSKFNEERQNLLREIDELDDRQRLSQERIAKYQAEASQELDIILDFEAEQKQKVPRLKMTISLYASTTGIKWDFSDPNLLSGQVVRRKLHSFRIQTTTSI